MRYKDQSISSFEDAMVGLRSHMSARVLGIWLVAWERSSHSCSYALATLVRAANAERALLR
jgi:hypothetical protein